MLKSAFKKKIFLKDKILLAFLSGIFLLMACGQVKAKSSSLSNTSSASSTGVSASLNAGKF